MSEKRRQHHRGWKCCCAGLGADDEHGALDALGSLCRTAGLVSLRHAKRVWMLEKTSARNQLWELRETRECVRKREECEILEERDRLESCRE